jgi:lipopolysaccharide export system permease protein
MHIKKLHLYVFKEVLNPFLGGIFFFAFVFLLFQMLRMAEELIVNNAPMSLVLKLLWALIVNFLPLGLPLAFLLGVLFAFARLSGDSEIIAMKAGGMSLTSISKPVFATAIVVSMLSLLLNLNWAPWSEVSSRQTLMKIGNRKFVSSINEGTFSSGFFNLIMFTERVNHRIGKMEKVFIYDDRDEKHPLTVISKTGEMIRVQSNEDDLGGVVLQLQDGSIHQSDLQNQNYNLANFATYQIYFDIQSGNGKFGYRPRMLGIGELQNKRNQPQITDQERRELDSDFWRRITVAMAPILFAFLGMGFGTVRTRGTRSSVLLVAFVTMALYWQVQVSAIWLGENGTLPPWLALQIPNLLVFIVGGFMFKRATW